MPEPEIYMKLIAQFLWTFLSIPLKNPREKFVTIGNLNIIKF